MKWKEGSPIAKQYPKHFKEQVLKDVEEIGSVPQVAKRHGVSDKTVYRWVAQSEHSDWKNTQAESKQTSEYIPSAKEFRELEKENIKLKQILGEKDLEISVLNDIVKKKKLTQKIS